MREVVRLLKRSEIDLKITGRGTLSRTIPAKGQPLGNDKKIEVIFLENN